MPDTPTPHHYRNLAKEARRKATATSDIDLHQSYLELAADYEAVAETLDRIRRGLALSHST